MTAIDSAIVPESTKQTNRYYFVAWRWHFYAGLYVTPFLLMLAITGLVMLWINALTELNGERMSVPTTGPHLEISVLQANAEATIPDGKAVQFIAPMAEGRVAVFRVDLGEEATTVLVNPYTGEVVDSFPWRAGWYDLANDVHGTLLVGNLGDWLIEAAASLGILMVVTGLYLHWPRNGQGSIFVPNLRARGRALWKSLHGVGGFWMSAILIVFLISGLSWSGLWGSKIVQAWSTSNARKLVMP